MSAANLKKVLEDLVVKLETNSATYRKLVSDKLPHLISISEEEVTEEIYRELLNRNFKGHKTLDKSIIDVVEMHVPKFIETLYDELEKLYNQDANSRKSYVVTSLVKLPSKKGFQAVLESKPGKSGNVFQYFRKIKQLAQRPFVAALNAQIKVLKETRKSEDISVVKSGSFVDIGHSDATAVYRQREKLVSSTIQKFSSTPLSRDTQQFLTKLTEELQISMKKIDGDPISTIEVSLESSIFNRSKDADVSNIAADLQKQIEAIGEEWASVDGSDSKVSRARKTVLKPWKNLAVRNKKVVADIEDTIIIESNKIPVVKKKKVNRRKGKTLDSRLSTQKVSTYSPRATISYASLIGILNSKLPETVAKNMKTPALQYQTGRFANSVLVTDILSTSKGFPSIGYTYQKSPYQTFEVGYKQGSQDRDPRRLIDRSIREIAVDLAIGRFYTRRV